MSDPLGNPEATPPAAVGKYQILDVLGHGAMGVVYRARDTVLQREVALKVMAASIAGDPEFKARFEREARAAAQLSHPHVVTVFDLGYGPDGSPYIAMELLKGRDLHSVLAEGPPLSLDRKLQIMVQVLLGLSHAHRAGIVHRDVKPGNIFLTEEGAAKILDFGMARLTRGAGSGTASIMGTADYMSPEQVRGASVDGRSDVFSCGSILFELITGERPFHGDSLVNIVYRIAHGEPDYGLVPPGKEHAALLPILRRTLARDVAARYSSARELALDLEACIGDEGLRRIVTTAAQAETMPAIGPSDGEPTADLGLPATLAASAATLRASTPPPRRGRSALYAVLAAAVAVVTAALYLRYGGASPAPSPGRGRAPSPPASLLEATPAPAPSTEAPEPTTPAIPSPEASGRLEPTPAPAHAEPQRVVRGRWRGYITDEFCRTRGATADHWKCVQDCMKKGRRPMLAVGDKLYWIAGLERIRGDRNKKVTVYGHLDTATGILTVAGGH